MRLHSNGILSLITNQATNNHWALNGRFLLILKVLQLTVIQLTRLPVKLLEKAGSVVLGSQY